ncbi:hypothetical protein [Arthrobacter sp. M4]|uniref:hypothetical protein n=1 Tax=Arthrobacter sp. M4 TaxID=218160 RepID=UPI001CDCF64C|nr:hypothetical protein [Arthrobacter sp. M4]MCA4132198.1 hypothetical protein [Arthrobacter sp. M4]
MKITVQRSGGVAAVNRVWTVQAVTQAAKERWLPIVDACPWDEVSNKATSTRRVGADSVRTNGAPRSMPADRFVYSIRAGQRRATLPEQDVTGPWRVLVESAKTEGEQQRGR